VCSSDLNVIDGQAFSPTITTTFTVLGTDVNGCTSTSEIEILVNSCTSSTSFTVVAFIEGYYIGSNQMTSVRINQEVPGAISTEADEVTIELWDAGYTLVDEYTGILNTDGTISCDFSNATAGSSYYIVFKHRSAVETWSSSLVTISANGIYDFTTSAGQAFGSNQSDNGDGTFSIKNGDVNQDGAVDISDLNILDTDFQNGLGSAYLSTDLNGDGAVDITDFNLLDFNFQSGVGVYIP
jgi:hypothetical protein